MQRTSRLRDDRLARSNNCMSGDHDASELDLLRRLRDAPELFERLRQETGTEFARQQKLRAEFPDALVRAALTLDDLRRKGRIKFTRSDQMWFDRTGLEQATSEAVARHKAQRYTGRVWDLCCGIGSDAIALASRGETVAVDLSPVQCLRTEWNAAAYGVSDALTVRTADVERIELPRELIHLDPDRRPGGRGRSVRLEEGVPGLPFLQNLVETHRGGAIKVSPAANFLGKFPGAEIELVSLDGECREATIWYGELAESDLWRATLLPSGATLRGHPLDWVCDLAPLGRYLYDPDPAVVRSGLVDRLAVESNLKRLDAAEEYLTSDEFMTTPFAQPFHVVAELPYREKELRAWFREHPCGALEIKCRHIAVSADELRRRLPREGRDPAVLVIARIEGKSRAVVTRRLREFDSKE